MMENKDVLRGPKFVQKKRGGGSEVASFRDSLFSFFILFLSNELFEEGRKEGSLHPPSVLWSYNSHPCSVR